MVLRLAKYDDEIPQIAQLLAIDELNVTVEWLFGTYYSNWSVWKERGIPVQETLPKNAVISKVHFTKSKRQVVKSVYFVTISTNQCNCITA